VVSFLAFLADRACKEWALRHAAKQVSLLPGLVSTTLTTNTGATFGLLTGNATLLAVVSAMILGAVLVLWWFEARSSAILSVGVGLLVGGALGNLHDRALLGYVVDFLRFDFLPWWPAFNVADCLTVIGVGMILGRLLWASSATLQRNKIE
jgi:signal peptidase II